jgi:hypothetical protein
VVNTVGSQITVVTLARRPLFTPQAYLLVLRESFEELMKFGTVADFP